MTDTDTYELATFQHVPSGGYSANAEDGTPFVGADFEDVVRRLEIYNRANNLAGEARSMVDTQTATRLARANDFRYVRVVSDSFHRKLSQYLSGTAAWVKLKALMAAGQPAFVDRDLAMANATICGECSYNKFPKKSEAMATTDAMMEDLAKETGGLPEELEAKLGNCWACTCSLKALVWLNPNVVVESMSGKEAAVLRRQPQCWKLKYLKEWEKRTGKQKKSGGC